MGDVGTWEWAMGADSDRGVLSTRDRWVLRARGVPVLVRDAFWRYGRFLGVRPGDLRVSGPLVDEITNRYLDVSTAGLCQSAYEKCKKLSDKMDSGLTKPDGAPIPWLLDHCLRTFGFGVMRAIQLDAMAAVNWDLLFVAAMLHDIELCGAPCRDGETPCFAVRGAEVAYNMAIDHGWPDAEAEMLRATICIHLNPGVKASEGLEAHLLSFGTALDVAGIGFYAMPQNARSAVTEWVPRHDGLRGQIWTQWSTEAACAPRCRGEFLNRPFGSRLLGLEKRVCNAPFDDK